VYVIIGFFGDVYAETLAVFDRRDDPLSHYNSRGGKLARRGSTYRLQTSREAGEQW